MTPEEAVDTLVRAGVIEGDRLVLTQLLEAVKATAKAKETRRCAALLTKQYEELIYTRDYNAASYVLRIRNSILTTGGLEAEE